MTTAFSGTLLLCGTFRWTGFLDERPDSGLRRVRGLSWSLRPPSAGPSAEDRAGPGCSLHALWKRPLSRGRPRLVPPGRGQESKGGHWPVHCRRRGNRGRPQTVRHEVSSMDSSLVKTPILRLSSYNRRCRGPVSSAAGGCLGTGSACGQRLGPLGAPVQRCSRPAGPRCCVRTCALPPASGPCWPVADRLPRKSAPLRLLQAGSIKALLRKGPAPVSAAPTPTPSLDTTLSACV